MDWIDPVYIIMFILFVPAMIWAVRRRQAKSESEELSSLSGLDREVEEIRRLQRRKLQ